ncbi:mixed lineage kinase domain-like protein [Pantherophis guttatus]|uniref:Mixed lineage kinase domain-like protein n=1 Tax=Pantherophis guttatus TaxID=94885 RepID=A0A6P9CN48_PANGU|nr:mixed lineage kinase domain-like protein [Pantherophis guttatus]
MDIVERILAVAKIIYGQYQHMKYCKKQKERLVKRMEILLRPIELLQAQSLSKLSSNLKWMLQNMLDLLLEAQELFEKYKNHNMLERFMKAGEMLEEFANLNERFGDMGQGLLLQLQVEQKVLVSFQKCVVSKECCQDLAEDKVCWKEMAKGQQEEAHTEITEINKSFLTKMTFLSEMKDHILYKGEYYKSPVAVKVFKNPLTINTKKVRQIFEEEICTLKRLESSYIVRLYGICIDESGTVPQFSIVTEYCEKGTLREVLRKEQDLPWKIRCDMASDAAAGLYRLHQTGEKCQLHRCINSSKFLVAKGYCVKLSGFKLDQTESSISRKSKDKVPREVSSLAYICPEGLASLHHPYNLASEIYSFGIVLWEIATGKLPFTGCNSQEIYKKVYKQKVQEPLGEDCPSYLQTIINQCRSYNPSKRPTTEVIVNQLLIDQEDNSSDLAS